MIIARVQYAGAFHLPNLAQQRLNAHTQKIPCVRMLLVEVVIHVITMRGLNIILSWSNYCAGTDC